MHRILTFVNKLTRLIKPPAIRAAKHYVVVIVLLLPITVFAQTSAPEAQVKAAFIINFAKFVEWPNPTNRSFRICVLSKNDTTLQELRRMADKKSIDGHPVEVRTVSAAADIPNCEVLFLPQSQQKDSAEFIHSSAPILTIGEFTGFVEEGGMLNLVTDNDHVRLQVNPDAAQAVGLKISSRLLAIAQVVHTRK